jgi:hypothetical protein
MVEKVSLVLGFLFHSLSRQTVEQILSDVEASAQVETGAYLSEMYEVLLEAIYSELKAKEQCLMNREDISD